MLSNWNRANLLLAFIMAGTCIAQLSANQPLSPRVRIVTMPVTMSAGSSTDITVKIFISSPYHIQANPASYNYLIPAQLQLQVINGLTPGKPVYPRGKFYRLTGSDLILSVYDGEISIIQTLHSSNNIAPGKYDIHGSFRFQACDHKRCLPPETLAITQAVEITSDH